MYKRILYLIILAILSMGQIPGTGGYGIIETAPFTGYLDGSSLCLGSADEACYVLGSADEIQIWLKGFLAETMEQSGKRQINTIYASSTSEYGIVFNGTVNKSSGNVAHIYFPQFTKISAPGSEYYLLGNGFFVDDTGRFYSAGGFLLNGNLTMYAGKFIGANADLVFNAAGDTLIYDYVCIGDGVCVPIYLDESQGDLLIENELEVQGEAVVTGHQTAHAAVYQLTVGNIISIANPDEWTEVDGWSDSDSINRVTTSDTGFIVQQSGHYKMEMVMSGSASPNKLFDFSISINDVICTCCQISRFFSASDEGAIAVSCMRNLIATDVLKVEILNRTDDTDFTIRHSNFNIHKL
jgi:hypothetical protein